MKLRISEVDAMSSYTPKGDEVIPLNNRTRLPGRLAQHIS